MSTDLSELLHGSAGQLVHVQPIAPRSAQYATPATPLLAALQEALQQRGITRLYRHQAAAIDAARAGQHLGVVTATASGKTLCYQLPTLEALLVEPQARALFLFPTKALAADQLRSLQSLTAALPNLGVATLDGDTPRPERERIRKQARIVLSNPDLLHRTLLPDHTRWRNVLANLRMVVLDEAHIYRGVFGTHVAFVLRRLRRICAHYGVAPQFILCSATSANPAEHLAALVGAPVQVIDGDGAPQGPRSFAFWNPPLIEQLPNRRGQAILPAPAAGGGRRSTNIETANLLAELLRAGIKTLTFTRTRRGAELVLRYARAALEDAPELAARLAAYRAGYTAEDRRQLEQAFLSGALLGLVSTNALELGIDIGGVDAVLMAGFPGSIASSWQQAGRAGRSQQPSLAVLVAQDDPLDQFYMRHPQIFFARPHEYARVALENPYILAEQLRCAGAELPLYAVDAQWFGMRYAALSEWLLRRGELHELDDGRMATIAARPAATVNIRSADGEPLELRDRERNHVIERIAATRAPFEVYPGAVYLHQGDSYLVEGLYARHAEARRVDVNYYTQVREETEIQILKLQEQRRCGPVDLALGAVEVTRTVTGYRRKQHFSEAVLSEHDLSLPPQSFRTIAVWWTLNEQQYQLLHDYCLEGVDALHALEHAAIGLLPLFAQCDRADIGGLSTNLHPHTARPTIFVYDGVPGGVGIAQLGYEQAEQWWEQTRTLLNDCPCAEGCPACIQSPKCGNGNQHLSKSGALALACLLAGKPLPQHPLSPPALAATAAVIQAGVLADLRRRLERIQLTPPGARRDDLLSALRYRLWVERDALTDPACQADLDELDRLAASLD